MNEEGNENLEHEIPAGAGDHCVLVFDYITGLKTMPIGQGVRERRIDYKKVDYMKLSEYLKSVQWEEELRRKTVQETMDKVKLRFQLVFYFVWRAYNILWFNEQFWEAKTGRCGITQSNGQRKS